MRSIIISEKDLDCLFLNTINTLKMIRKETGDRLIDENNEKTLRKIIKNVKELHRKIKEQ